MWLPKKWLWIISGSAALFLLVVGIATDGTNRPPAAAQPFDVPPAPSASAVPAADEQTPEQEAMYGPRVELPGGLLVKQLGKVAEMRTGDDPTTWTIRVVVDSIDVDPDCGPENELFPPTRAHRLVVSLRAETSERYRRGWDLTPQFYEWSTIGLDGVSEASASSSTACRPDEAFPHELRPAAKYRGEVTVETDNPAGQLVLANGFVYDYPTSDGP